jgi:hypothetical protein
MDKPVITFDEEGKIRVLEEEKFKATEDLEKEARTFLSSKLRMILDWFCDPSGHGYIWIAEIQEFSSTVHSVVDKLKEQALRIEHAKLKVILEMTNCMMSFHCVTTLLQAVGQRNLVESEREARKIKQQELHALVEEKRAELRRLTVEHESLLRIESEQREVIEKLGNNEAGGV